MEISKWKVECDECVVEHCRHYDCAEDEPNVSMWQCASTQFKKRFCSNCRIEMVDDGRKREFEKIKLMQKATSEEFDAAKHVFQTGLQPCGGNVHYWINGKTGEEFMSCKDDPVEAWNEHMKEKEKNVACK